MLCFILFFPVVDFYVPHPPRFAGAGTALLNTSRDANVVNEGSPSYFHQNFVCKLTKYVLSLDWQFV